MVRLSPVACAFILLSASAHAYSVSPNPGVVVPDILPGNYQLTGLVSSSICSVPENPRVSGVLVYPGADKPGFTVVLPTAASPANATAVVGPPVPKSGLDGWSSATPGGGLRYFLSGGAVVNTGEPVNISFSLFNITGTITQGTLTLSGGDCVLNYAVTLVRTGGLN